MVRIQLTGELFRFEGTPDLRNVSGWVDWRQFATVKDAAGTQLTMEEMEALPGLCIRILCTPAGRFLFLNLQIVIATVDSNCSIISIIKFLFLDEQMNILFCHVHPSCLQTLTEQVTTRGISLSSFAIPVFALVKGKSSALKAPLFPLEKPNLATGLSVLPLLFTPGQAQPFIPTLRDLKNEVFALQRTSPLPQHVTSPARVHKMCTDGREWEEASQVLELLWPEPQMQIIQGKIYFHYGWGLCQYKFRDVQ